MIYDNIKKVDQFLLQIQREVEGYEKYFKAKGTVVDVGAHVGIFTKNVVDRVDKIYSIEPDPLFFKDLNKIRNDKVIKINKAISSYNGKAKIKSDGNTNELGTEGEDVQIITFKRFLEENKIDKVDFLKIDCEGGEYDILTEENIKKFAKDKTNIAGELHFHNPKQKALLPLMLYNLRSNGYTVAISSVDGVNIPNLEQRLDYYKEVIIHASINEIDAIIKVDYIDGCALSITNALDVDYKVSFINKETNQVLYDTVITNNNWTRCNYQYFIDWRVEVKKDDKIVASFDLDLTDKTVMICIDSKSLGDTLAWFPYIDEFRKKHNCKVIASTYSNNLFVNTYPDIEFVNPDEKISVEIDARYTIGWFYLNEDINYYKHPLNPRIQPMQKTASDILGLEFEEIKPILSLPDVEKENIVSLGIHSTAQVKYWNNPTGWQDVTDYLLEKDYKVISLSREPDGFKGNKEPVGSTKHPECAIEEIIETLCKSKLYIGVGTGLTWLAWACNTPLILISGFSEPYTEMQEAEGVIRISTPKNKNITHGCFNNYKLDPANWNWYEPKQFVGTERQYECSKSITSKEVIDNINKIL